MLNIFYGRECTDRDRFIFDNIISARAGAENRTNTILLVPDQFSLQAEKDAFHYLRTQSLMDIDVLSFSRLSDRVIGETGGRRLPVIDKQGRHMLLTKVMNEHAGELEVYGKYKSSAGFLEMANNMISELKQCGITPNKLDEICGARTDNGEKNSRDDDGSRAQKQRPLAAGKLLNRKLTEIAGIYRGYEEAIEGHYIDTEDLAGLFISNIKDSRTVKDSLFWVYGFDVFSPKNLQALEMLIKHSRGVNVVLTYDEGCKDENLFAAVRETMDRLEKAAENVNVRTHISKISEGYLRPQYLSDKHIELAHLEKNLYAMPPGKLENSNGNQITLVRASSVYAEAETAASYVMKLVRDKGFAYRDIVIICNDKGPRAEIYKQTFSRYGIRLFADEKRSIATSPAAVFVLALMQVISGGYKGEDMIRMLKTGLTDLDREETEKLENYVIGYKVNGAQWKKPFYKGKGEIEEEKLEELELLRKKAVAPVMAFHEKYKAEHTVAGKVMALYDYLENGAHLGDGVHPEDDAHLGDGVHPEDDAHPGDDILLESGAYPEDDISLEDSAHEDKNDSGAGCVNEKKPGGVPEKLDLAVKAQIERGELEKASETAQVWNRLVGVLDQLVEILGEESIDAPSFCKLLESGIKAVEIGVLPPALDGLIMGSMQRTRSGNVKAVVVLAANEGILPMSLQGSGLLSEKERLALMEASGSHLLKTDELRAAEERLAIYRNLSRPECELYMSMAESAGDNEAGRPSLIFERIRNMFPDIKVRKDIFAEGDPWEMIGSPESTLIHMTQSVKQAKLSIGGNVKASADKRADGDAGTDAVISADSGVGTDAAISANSGVGTDAAMHADGDVGTDAVIHEDGDAGSDNNYAEEIWNSVINWYRTNKPELLEIIDKGLKYDGKIDETEGRYIRELYTRGKRKNFAAETENKNNEKTAAEDEFCELTVSPTRLERFSGCPFAHFLQYGLKVRERKVYEVGGLEMGDIHHQCLDKFSRELNYEAKKLRADSLTGDGSPWMTITKEECAGRVARIMDDLAAGYKDGLMHDSKAEEYRLRRMKNVCIESAWMMTEHIRKSAVADMMCEAQFGKGSRLAPVEVDTKNGKVIIGGKIDRMDILPDNMVKIIDYKSGNESFDEKEARAGWKIQLMMYMRAAAVNGYEPVATFYYNLKDPVVDADKAKGDIEKAIRREFKMAGIVRNEPEVLEKLDRSVWEGSSASNSEETDASGQPGSGSANGSDQSGNGSANALDQPGNGSANALDQPGKGSANALDQPGNGNKKTKKKGRSTSEVFVGGKALKSREEFDELVLAVNGKIDEMCEQIMDGNIDIKPKRSYSKTAISASGKMESKTACSYCPYHSICKFDTQFDECKYEYIK